MKREVTVNLIPIYNGLAVVGEAALVTVSVLLTCWLFEALGYGAEIPRGYSFWAIMGWVLVIRIGRLSYEVKNLRETSPPPRGGREGDR